MGGLTVKNPMTTIRSGQVLSPLIVLAALLSTTGILAVARHASTPPESTVGAPQEAKAAKAKANKYVGVQKCKNCHQSEKSGDQYGKWEGMHHAKAYHTLLGDKAKELAKARGIEEPHKAAECLKCHVTAHGEPAKSVDKKFDPTLGVQCETCHGPGDNHVKARFAAALESEGIEQGYQQIPAGEIIVRPEPKVCLGCHNEESPSFQPFCFREKAMKIQHWDPRKARSAEEIEAWKCSCGGGENCTCKAAECGGYPESGSK